MSNTGKTLGLTPHLIFVLLLVGCRREPIPPREHRVDVVQVGKSWEQKGGLEPDWREAVGALWVVNGGSYYRIPPRIPPTDPFQSNGNCISTQDSYLLLRHPFFEYPHRATGSTFSVGTAVFGRNGSKWLMYNTGRKEWVWATLSLDAVRYDEESARLGDPPLIGYQSMDEWMAKVVAKGRARFLKGHFQGKDEVGTECIIQDPPTPSFSEPRENSRIQWDVENDCCPAFLPLTIQGDWIEVIAGQMEITLPKSHNGADPWFVSWNPSRRGWIRWRCDGRVAGSKRMLVGPSRQASYASMN